MDQPRDDGVALLIASLARTAWYGRIYVGSVALYLLMLMGFVAMGFAINYAFAGRSLKLWLIDGGYHTMQFALYGLVLGAWH